MKTLKLGKKMKVIDMEKKEEKYKPRVKLIGEDGNIFGLIGIATKALKNESMHVEANALRDRVMGSGSYGEALSIIGEYVDIR